MSSCPRQQLYPIVCFILQHVVYHGMATQKEVLCRGVVNVLLLCSFAGSTHVCLFALIASVNRNTAE